MPTTYYNYHLLKELGRGAQGIVVGGTHVETGQEVAIKILDQTRLQHSATAMKNLQREISALQRLVHDHIVKFIEWKTDILFRFADGEKSKDIEKESLYSLPACRLVG